MHRLPILALTLALATPWWNTILRTTSDILHLNQPITVEQPAPPPTIDAGCEWDPLGKCITG